MSERPPRYFPVRHAIGVDISDVSVEMLELTRGVGGKLSVSALSHADLPPNTVRDGEILDPAGLGLLLRKTFNARSRLFRARAAIVSLPESKVYLHAFEFPKQLGEEELRRAIPFEAEGVLPLTLDEVYYDVLFHRSRLDTQHVLFAAAPRRIVDGYLTALHDGGLVPIAFDVESAALARSIVGERSDPVLVADIGGRATVISVVEREAVHSAVTISVAGDAFTESIAATLRIPPEEAEARKRREGLTGGAGEALTKALADVLVPLIQELRRTAQYHEMHTGRTARELLLAGGSAQLPGIVEHLASETGLTVRIGDPWATRDVQVPEHVPAIDRARLAETRGAFATVVGLALRGVTGEPAAAGINLLPASAKRPYLAWRGALASSALAVVTAAVTLVLASVVSVTALSRWFDARQAAVAAAGVREQLAGDRLMHAAEEARRANAELTVLKNFQRGAPDLPGFFRDLRGAIVEGITLQTVEAKVPPEPEKPLTVKVAGIAVRREAFLAFETRLKTLKSLQSLESPLSNLNVREHAPFVLFLEMKRP